jgi:hypothetical protein
MNNAPDLYYTCEDCTATLQNPDLEVLDEWMKEHHGHKIITTRKYGLYDLGYNDLKKAVELAQIADHLGAIVVDIRFQPHTRNPEFSLTHLQEVLGKSYIHIGELGNKNYKDEGEIQLVNAEVGIAKVHSLLAEKSVILICACWKRLDCHRLVVSNEYKKRHKVASTPISRADARSILAKVKSDQDPQMSLFDQVES